MQNVFKRERIIMQERGLFEKENETFEELSALAGRYDFVNAAETVEESSS